MTKVDIADLKHLSANLNVWISTCSSDPEIANSLYSCLQTVQTKMTELVELRKKMEEQSKKEKTSDEAKTVEKATAAKAPLNKITRPKTFISEKEKERMRQKPVVCRKRKSACVISEKVNLLFFRNPFCEACFHIRSSKALLLMSKLSF